MTKEEQAAWDDVKERLTAVKNVFKEFLDSSGATVKEEVGGIIFEATSINVHQWSPQVGAIDVQWQSSQFDAANAEAVSFMVLFAKMYPIGKYPVPWVSLKRTECPTNIVMECTILGPQLYMWVMGKLGDEAILKWTTTKQEGKS